MFKKYLRYKHKFTSWFILLTRFERLTLLINRRVCEKNYKGLAESNSGWAKSVDGRKQRNCWLVKITLLFSSAPRVNFTNILHAAFTLISLRQKITISNFKHIKAAQNTYVQKNMLVIVGEIDSSFLLYRADRVDVLKGVFIDTTISDVEN